MILWDTHCHLADPRFAPDIEAVCARAADAGLEAVVIVAADPGAWTAASSLRPRFAGGARPFGRFAYGLHPHEARLGGGPVWDGLRRCLAQAATAALGEIGLDYHYDFSDAAAQRSALERQLDLAAELDLPVILHERESSGDLLPLLRAVGLPRRGGVWHCFSGGPALAEQALALGLHLGFGGLATFARGTEDIRAAAASCPEDRLLLETDAPYLTPAPRRGGRNEPARIADVLAALAPLRGSEPEDLARATTGNARRLFGGVLP